jgi:nicotinamide-nucleotide amidase
MTDLPLTKLTEQLAGFMLAAGQRLATAESCTGGWLAKTLTDLPGSSRWFECGYVTYSNEAKVRDLGVSPETLTDHGAVSEQTAREMAAGTVRRTGAQVAIAITGVAGPDGGSPGKPVGTVWFAVAFENGREGEARVQHFSGDRDSIRRDSVKYALEWLVAIQVVANATTV